MTTELVEIIIKKAVEQSAPYCVDMITGWIRDSITGNTYMVSEMKEARFQFISNDKMIFTALVKAHIGRDFDETTIAKVSWQKNGDKLTREFTLL